MASSSFIMISRWAIIIVSQTFIITSVLVIRMVCYTIKISCAGLFGLRLQRAAFLSSFTLENPPILQKRMYLLYCSGESVIVGTVLALLAVLPALAVVLVVFVV